jgi:phage-related protein
VVNVIGGLIHGDWSRVWKGIQQILGGVWTAMEAVVRGAIGNVKALMAAGLGVLASIARAAGTAILSAISSAFHRIVDAVRTGVSDVVALIRSLPGAAVGALGNLGSALYNAGAELIGGFVRGIVSKIGSVKDTLGGLTKSLTSWKGPPEKDKVLLYGSGQLVMGGFQRGLESVYPEIQKSLGGFTDRIAADAYRGVGQAISRAQELLRASSSVDISAPSGMAATTYRTADGSPLSNDWVQTQIDASLAANPDASKGGYMGDPSVWATPESLSAASSGDVVLELDGSVLAKFNRQELDRKGRRNVGLTFGSGE